MKSTMNMPEFVAVQYPSAMLKQATEPPPPFVLSPSRTRLTVRTPCSSVWEVRIGPDYRFVRLKPSIIRTATK